MEQNVDIARIIENIADELGAPANVLQDARPQIQASMNRPDGPAETVVYASATEQTVADIFRELLAVQNIGRTDEFFELGGHSLLAVDALAKVKQRMDVELEPAILFTSSLTVKSLSEAIDAELNLQTLHTEN